SGRLGSYIATVRLIRASDRRLVKEVSITFDSATNYGSHAGTLKSELSSGGSIRDVIYQFEKPIRDDPANNTAWNATLGHWDGEEGPGLTPDKLDYTV